MHKIEETKVYKTTDGRLFEEKADAIAHQESLTFDDWYKDNYVLGSPVNGRVELAAIKDWLTEHRDTVQRFLEAQ